MTAPREPDPLDQIADVLAAAATRMAEAAPGTSDEEERPASPELERSAGWR